MAYVVLGLFFLNKQRNIMLKKGRITLLQNGLPQKQGLYDPRFEHDNCGIGCLVNIKGRRSHKIINDAIEILKNLTHRGGVGSEPDTGDGAGILIQIPHGFMKKVCSNENVEEIKNHHIGNPA